MHNVHSFPIKQMINGHTTSHQKMINSKKKNMTYINTSNWKLNESSSISSMFSSSRGFQSFPAPIFTSGRTPEIFAASPCLTGAFWPWPWPWLPRGSSAGLSSGARFSHVEHGDGVMTQPSLGFQWIGFVCMTMYCRKVGNLERGVVFFHGIAYQHHCVYTYVYILYKYDTCKWSSQII